MEATLYTQGQVDHQICHVNVISYVPMFRSSVTALLREQNLAEIFKDRSPTDPGLRLTMHRATVLNGIQWMLSEWSVSSRGPSAQRC